LSGVPVLAQKTGALLHQTDSTRRVRRGFEPGATAESAAKGDTIFAALVFDPSLAAPARSSAWTANVFHAGAVTEARIQANVCDIAGAICGATRAASLMVAGPLNKTNEFTRLADLDGLVGTARVQASYASNATNVGAFYSFTGTFSRPRFAYRDSVALGRRSVEHSTYAIETGGGRRWSSVSLYGGVRWEQAYHARTAHDVCTPAAFGPAGTQSCASLVVGGPRGRERAVATATGAWSNGGNAAAPLTISQDNRRGVTRIDQPVWLLQNPGGGLAGGVRLGYRTDAREMTVALFVSQFKL
ncbi:MAG: hypothetical protein ACHQQR_10860, partial [Gemmatimonadales bacterium]